MAFTIDSVKRLPGTGTAKYAKGRSYKIPFQIFFHGGWSESALMNNTNAALPKTGWLLGAESSPAATDGNVYADQIDFQVASDDSPYGADASGMATYTVQYEQITATFNPNPLSRVDIVWGGAEDSETVKYDVDGKRIANSAGELYSPLPMRPIRGAECCITVRQLANPAAIVALYSYSTNESAMWGNVDAENGLFGKIQARLVSEDALRYWEVSYPIKFRRDSWRLKLIDNGYVFLDDDSTQQVNTDELGRQKAIATLLDGHGHPVVDPTNPDAAQIFPADGYEINEKMDWSSLGLPNPFTYSGS